MAISGVPETDKPQKLMAMARERAKPSHSFYLNDLKWGNQRILRCMKVNSNGEISSDVRRSSASEAESESLISIRRETEAETLTSLNGSGSFNKPPLPPTGVSGRKSKAEGDGGNGIEAIREKLMFDLRAEADKMKVSILEESEGEEEQSAAAVAVVARPWNLRKRRAACKAPNEIGRGGSSTIEERKISSSPLRTENLTTKSLRLRGLAVTSDLEKKDTTEFSISLSREEIEEDFIAMTTGTKPSRKPKKRAKIVQSNLDSLCPGLWLSHITPDSYKVSEIPESGRR